MHIFGYIVAGTIEIFPGDEDLSKVEEVIDAFISSLESHVLDSLDMDLADQLIDSLKQLTDMLLLKKEQDGLNISKWHKHNKSIFYMIIKCLGVYNNFKLLNKPEPEHIVNQKKAALSLLKNMTKLLPGESPEEASEERDFFDFHVKTYFDEFFPGEHLEDYLEKCKEWTLSNQKMRMFYVIFELLQPSHYLYSLDAKSTIFDRLISVFASVLSSAPVVKNFNLKSIFLQ